MATPTAAPAGRRPFADRSVRTKVLSVAGVMALAAVLVASVTLVGMRMPAADAQEMYSSRVQPLQQLTEIQRAFQGDRARVIQYGIADDAIRAGLRTELVERKADLAAQLDAYEPNAIDATSVDAIRAALATYYAAAEDTLFPLADAGDTAAARTSRRPCADLPTAVMDAIQAETTAQGEAAAELAAHSHRCGVLRGHVERRAGPDGLVRRGARTPVRRLARSRRGVHRLTRRADGD
ncbi:MCP four helix bundle domain-containing protein [Cellulomonas fimi]|uniref:Methyl-accepting chemotaxis protein n=1 Tax=Cellulomonas fimi (strain ATCC 484 / DSM 20113 / JCM 1341 / CCUG 24087 / LMG 16345 / NBRC 15513 / NCIMB 8980 / NCTC 7547 / NRS-133) TaxID=590998 RepID=F4H1V6_CELFA|nr:MCP four helix bundle domain-containing protein [Cellulomonas fimi]AEE47526.1 methyl-accepting chemotaxis protein [Cellulomonas fimi ATCC 484]VEH36467.1 Four helix bundle sensory module for signal transduction [Cellulomonas fimi]